MTAEELLKAAKLFSRFYPRDENVQQFPMILSDSL
jgi:hypothetical protein